MMKTGGCCKKYPEFQKATCSQPAMKSQHRLWWARATHINSLHRE